MKCYIYANVFVHLFNAYRKNDRINHTQVYIYIYIANGDSTGIQYQ